jgi:hypothetical protein
MLKNTLSNAGCTGTDMRFAMIFVKELSQSGPGATGFGQGQRRLAGARKQCLLPRSSHLTFSGSVSDNG